MKKNPFPGKVVAVFDSILGLGWCLDLEKSDPDCEMNKERARYAAEAINKHEELVEFVASSFRVNRDGDGYRCNECGIINASPRCWQENCKRAALLKEEEVNHDG